MKRALGLSGAAVLVAVTFVGRSFCAPPSETKLAHLEFRVEALSKLDDLAVTGEQLKALKALAVDTAGQASPEQLSVKGTAAYQTALQTLQDALIDGDDEKISDAQDAVDSMRDSDNIDPDIDIPITDAARAKAPEALKLMNSTQIASYLSEHSEDVPDAADTIEDAMDQCDDAKTDYVQLRGDAADQVGLLVAGLDADAARLVAQKVDGLLDRVHAMSETEYKDHRREMDAQAREIVGSIDSFEQLRHWMQGEMADLLTNPEINTVLNLRIKSEAKAATRPKEQ
jgi:hypothetical protein